MFSLITLFLLTFNVEASPKPIFDVLNEFQCGEQPHEDWTKTQKTVYDVPGTRRIKGKIDRTVIFVDQDQGLEAVGFLTDTDDPKNKLKHSHRLYKFFIREFGEPITTADVWIWTLGRGVMVFLGPADEGFLTVIQCPQDGG